MLSDLHPEASALVTRVAACFILSFLTTGRPGAPGEGRGLFPPNLSCHLDPGLLPSCQPFGCLLDRKRRTTPTPSPPPIPGGTGVHRCAARLCLHEAKTKLPSCQPFGCLLDRKRRTTPTPSPPPIPGGTGVHRCAARLCLHEAKTKHEQLLLDAIASK